MRMARTKSNKMAKIKEEKKLKFNRCLVLCEPCSRRICTFDIKIRKMTGSSHRQLKRVKLFFMAAALIPDSRGFCEKVNEKLQGSETIRITFGNGYLAVRSKAVNEKQQSILLHGPELNEYYKETKQAIDFLVNYDQFKKMLGQVEKMEKIYLVVDIGEEPDLRIIGEESKRMKQCFIDAISFALPIDAPNTEWEDIKNIPRMELPQELRELMSDQRQRTADNSYKLFLKQLDRITTSEEHAYLYNMMLQIMQTMIMAQPNHSMIFSFEEKALVIQSFDENMYHYKKLVIPEQNIDQYVYKRRIIEVHEIVELINALEKLASKKKETHVWLQLHGEFDTELTFTVFGDDIHYKLTLRTTLKLEKWNVNVVEREEDCKVLVARKQFLQILDLAQAGDVMKIEVRGPRDVRFFSKNMEKTIEITFPIKDNKLVGIRVENAKPISSLFNASALRMMAKDMDIIKFVTFRMYEMGEAAVVNFTTEKFNLLVLMPSIAPPDGNMPFEEFYDKLRIYENDSNAKLVNPSIASDDNKQASPSNTIKKEEVSSKKRKATREQNVENLEKPSKIKQSKKENSKHPAS
ncbi:Oidioi.mRNA.OKI2018_I69.chr2.g7155.t1.cds [Oikopleura dioica]|uniref:Oidioi.mRNA.OKI2018_I69.chr2.g7155.t1.cds n=1 Tax=Oikopleura dioica TaxID=34765 RepID=A0ABN7T691_OIKDI|nr:Oidioi.mRNA.OKI2018_I69.chr2.g7155.t1.cds [Oikopleura dioica]